MHVQELGGLASETPDLLLQVQGRKSGIHQHKPTSKRHIVSITLPETSTDFNMRQQMLSASNQRGRHSSRPEHDDIERSRSRSEQAGSSATLAVAPTLMR